MFTFTEGQRVKVSTPSSPYYGVIGEIRGVETWAARIVWISPDGYHQTHWFENYELEIIPVTIIPAPEFDLEDMELAEIIIEEMK